MHKAKRGFEQDFDVKPEAVLVNVIVIQHDACAQRVHLIDFVTQG